MTKPKGTILLTGANGGLGSAIVSHIVTSSELKTSYHGIYTVRDASVANPSLDNALADRKGTAASHSHQNISLDLSRLSSVRAVAALINERVASGRIPRIHAIILNAGCEEYEK